MKTADIRNKFLQFFKNKDHTIVPSSSLVPANDPTLMFTNSGMVQFKDVFLGYDNRTYVRAVSCQACLRAGGKHNDLENVGYTARHHTFFEMLGNWSFGDYFKRDSIEWGWQLLTEVYKLDPDKLWVTVYFEDDEAYELWTKNIGLPPERVIRIGDNKGSRYASDNFWMMANIGPCGPCSEIFYDHGEQIAGGPPGSPDEAGDRFIEIWNHVFMQFDMQEDGSLKPLPAPCVDTGMGLERVAAILQGKHSNYETDLFQLLINAAIRETKTKDITSPSLKVIADHIRACVFMLLDGITLSNEGRGYVLRRIARRAIRHGYKLGVRSAFLYRLVPDVVNQMFDSYPLLKKSANNITNAIKQEEERFLLTIENGMGMLENEIVRLNKKSQKQLNGEIAFKLHDTYGFPLDLTQDVCREQNISVDINGFTEAMNKQKELARSAGALAGKFKSDGLVEYSGEKTNFCGYDKFTDSSEIVALYFNNEAVNKLDKGQSGIIVLSKTPFYAQSGGQVGDIGLLSNESASFMVADTQKIRVGVFGHFGELSQGVVKLGDKVVCKINIDNRKAIMRNHSVTHIMHKALRDVLGEHVQQKGSLVDSEKARFDFSHHQPVTKGEIQQIENLVNGEIMSNHGASAVVMDIDSAKQSGAMMLFDEKYDNEVRVVSIGSSKELCGGTHINLTGDIGLFKITSENGIASGVRRIEALTGNKAINYINNKLSEFEDIAKLLKTQGGINAKSGKVTQAVIQLQSDKNDFIRELKIIKEKSATSQGKDLAGLAKEINGIKLLTAILDEADNKALRTSVEKLQSQLSPAVIVLASVIDGKINLITGVSKNLTNQYQAGKIVNFVAQQVGGKGGGRPELAMAGGNLPENLAEALQSVSQLII